jgi:hypothetical protein
MDTSPSAVVHSGSTTGLEAIILGRDGINICVEDTAGHECFIPSGVNINAKNADEAVAAVERELFNNRALKRKNQRLPDLQPYLRTDAEQSPSRKFSMRYWE